MSSDFLELRKKYPSLGLADLQAVLKCSQITDKEAALSKASQGYPISYLLGEAPFGPVMLDIAPPLLIPRQETWEWLAAILPTLSPGKRALDLGCGPGTLGVGLSLFFPDYFELLAIDCSPEALIYAQKNLEKSALASYDLCQSDWFSGIEQGRVFDIIMANPPYCSKDEVSWMQHTEYESHRALFAEFGGLSCYNSIFQSARDYLSAQGILLFEHGAGQGAALVTLLSFYGYKYWQPIYDNTGAWRATYVRLS